MNEFSTNKRRKSDKHGTRMNKEERWYKTKEIKTNLSIFYLLCVAQKFSEKIHFFVCFLYFNKKVILKIIMSELEPNFDYSDNGYPVKEPVSYFGLSLQQPNKIRLINVGPELVRCIQERLEQLITVETFGYVIFKDYMQTRWLSTLTKNNFYMRPHISRIRRSTPPPRNTPT